MNYYYIMKGKHTNAENRRLELLEERNRQLESNIARQKQLDEHYHKKVEPIYAETKHQQQPQLKQQQQQQHQQRVAGDHPREVWESDLEEEEEIERRGRITGKPVPLAGMIPLEPDQPAEVENVRLVTHPTPAPVFEIPKADPRLVRKREEPRFVPVRTGRAYEYLMIEQQKERKRQRRKKAKARSSSWDKYDREYDPRDDNGTYFLQLQ